MLNRTCSACDNRHWAKGYCHTCYDRVKHHGTPTPLATRRAYTAGEVAQIEEWVWSGVTRAEIARRLNRTFSSICGAIQLHHLERRKLNGQASRRRLRKWWDVGVRIARELAAKMQCSVRYVYLLIAEMGLREVSA